MAGQGGILMVPENGSGQVGVEVPSLALTSEMSGGSP